MMKFSEYAHKRDQEINEGWGTAVNSAISGIGRVPIQFARGGWNAGLGAAQGLAGAGQTAAGIGKGFLGGGWDTAGRGLGNMAQGAGRTLSGVGQAALSPLSGLGRAYYANRPGSGGFLGMAPNTNNPGAWGSFKNWMGWQGKPQQAAVPPAQQQEPAQASAATPTNPGLSPQQQQASQKNPSYQGQAWKPLQPGQQTIQASPSARPATKPAMTPQQQAFFQNNPGFNASGRASQPRVWQDATPQSATSTQTWTPPASSSTGAWSPPASNPQQQSTGNWFDDYEAKQGWQPDGTKQTADQYSSWINNNPGSTPPASNNSGPASAGQSQPPSAMNLNQPSDWGSWGIDSDPAQPTSNANLLQSGSNANVTAPSNFQMQPSNPSMPSQTSQSQIPSDIAGVIANSLPLSRNWDGKRQLMPFEASQAMQQIKKFMQSNKDPQHQQMLQSTYNYLSNVANRRSGLSLSQRSARVEYRDRFQL